MEDKELIEKYKQVIKEYKDIEEDFKTINSKINEGNLSAEQRSEFYEDLKYDRERISRLTDVINILEKNSAIVEYNKRNNI